MGKETDIVCVGTALVDSIIWGFDPNPINPTGYRAEEAYLKVGGEAVNEAVAATRLGAKTSIVCSLGNDDAGDLVMTYLQKNNVDTSNVIRSGNPTPVTTLVVKPVEGTRKSITNYAHRYNFHPEQYLDRITSAKALIMGSLFRAPFNDVEIIREVVMAASDAGMLIFADTKLPNFGTIALEELKGILPYIDYITPNEDEAKFYSGEEDYEKMANVFLSYGAKNVIIKRGGKGLYFKNENTHYLMSAFPIAAKDATGAGDCLVAGLASELLRGTNIENALWFANACGGICTTEVGAGTALHDREQVLQFMEQQGYDCSGFAPQTASDS
ncbi:MAG: carbohydrate kinase family protein [Clostridiales bacterium]|nr:carbohydrate kinase family protein [Clostridiales bacterium]